MSGVAQAVANVVRAEETWVGLVSRPESEFPEIRQADDALRSAAYEALTLAKAHAFDVLRQRIHEMAAQ